MSCPCTGIASVFSGMYNMKEYLNPKNIFIGITILLLMIYGGFAGYGILNKKPQDLNAPTFKDSQTKYNIGELVAIDLKHNIVKYDKCTVVWKILDGLKEKLDFRSCSQDGIYFATGNQPKHLLVICVVNYLVDGEIKSYFLSTSIQIGNAPNPPNPNPPGPVEPTFPDEKLGLSSFTFKSFNTNITVPNRVELANGYVKNFDSILSAIVAGAYKSKKVENALEDLNKMNVKTTTNLGLNTQTTDPFWVDVQKQLITIQNRDGAYNWQSITQVFTEIRDGLKEVK